MSVESLQITVPQQDTFLLPNNSLLQDEFIAADSAVLSDSLYLKNHANPSPVISVLKGSDRSVKGFRSSELPEGNIDWITVHLVLVLAFLAWVRVVGGRRFSQVMQSFLAQRNMNIMMREGNIFSERIAVGLFLIHLVVISLISYLILIRLIPPEALLFQGFRLFAVVFLTVLVIRLLKNLLLTITGVVFRNQLVLSEYIPMNFIFNSALGLVLFPFVIIAVYLPSISVLYAAILIWLIAFIYRLFRQLLVTPEYTKFSYVNRILYLCTFEIAPVLVLIKLILKQLT